MRAENGKKTVLCHVIAMSTQNDVVNLGLTFQLLHCYLRMLHVTSRRKLEEWPDDGDTKKLTMEVKLGEEQFLEELIRFCYSKQIMLTDGEHL